MDRSKRVLGALPTKRFIATILACLALLNASVATAAQHNPPWADVYGGWWSDLNTTVAATKFKDNFAGSGYQIFRNTVTQADDAIFWAGDDAIWLSNGHSNRGFVVFCDEPGQSQANCNTSLNANAAVGSCDEPDACVSKQGTRLQDLRLMIFAGCYSALDGAEGSLQDGNLLWVAKYNQGVDNVFGFTGLVYWPMGNDWAAWLGQYLREGQTIQQSMYLAGQNTKNRWFGNPYGWTSFMGSAPVNAKVIPAGYGTP